MMRQCIVNTIVHEHDESGAYNLKQNLEVEKNTEQVKQRKVHYRKLIMP